MQAHTLGYLGFEPAEQEAITAILNLAEPALSCAWSVSTAADADVVMVNLDADNGQALLAGLAQTPPERRIIVVADNLAAATGQRWFLAKKRHAPPSLRALTSLLNEVSAAPTQPQPATAASPADAVDEPDHTADRQPPPPPAHQDAAPPAPTPPSQPLLARRHFFGLLLKAKKDKACRVYTHKQSPALYVSPADQRYYFRGPADGLASYLHAKPQFVAEQVIGKQKLQTLLAKEAVGQGGDLDELLAQAILAVSQGRLADGLALGQAFRLGAAPDLARLPSLAPYGAIAARLAQAPCSPRQCAADAHAPLATVCDFYSVCHWLDLLAPEDPPAPPGHDPQKPARLSTVLKRFFNKKII